MRTTTKRTEPAHVVSEHVDTCDRCGKPSGDDYAGLDTSFVTIRHEHGTRYPEGGSMEAQVVDCCPACWKAHVLPALRALGFSTRTEDW